MLNGASEQFSTSEITLNNWKDFPFSTHTFQNVAELIPVKTIKGRKNSSFHREIQVELLANSYQLSGQLSTGLEILEQTFTDALIVCKNGVIVSEYFSNGMKEDSQHLTFSVSKSITGIVAGIILKEYQVSADSLISDYLVGTEGGAYADATIRNLLDMTVSLDFDESYASKEGIYARYRQAMLWMPRSGGGEYSDENLEQFILSLPKAEVEHGFRFSYKSPNTDLLGLVLEKISNQPLAELISETLWKKIGCGKATITVDEKEMARTAGGLSCSIQDLAIVGELMRGGGILNGEVVIDPMWVIDTYSRGDHEPWKRGEFFESFPEGSYRNQWYSIGEGQLCAIGIHGQWIYINAPAGVVICKFSCQPKADDDELDRTTLEFFRQISARI